MKKKQLPSILKNQHGVSAVIIAISIFMLVGFVALSVDVFHLIVVKNELQNAADAGALAGAAALYKETLGASVDPSANQEAYDGATANKSEKVAVELYNYDGTANNQCVVGEDVQRGHWSFSNPSGDPPVLAAASGFSCNPSTVAVNIANYTTDQLNADSNFINAVQVRTQRTRLGTPIISFFARIFGYENFQMSATAVGYIGFAAYNVQVGAPIAICKESIGWPGIIACNEGRMFNNNNDTARWTSLEDCDGNTNAAKLKTILDQTCDQNTENPYVTTQEISTVEGQDNVALGDLIEYCWIDGGNEIVKDGVDENGDGENDTVYVPLDKDGDGVPDQPWKITLPVITCEGDDAEGPTCGPIVSAVEIKIVWMAMKDDIDPVYDPNKPNEPGAPDNMHYDIPSWDPTSETIVYTDSWPLSKPTYPYQAEIDDPYQAEIGWHYSSPDQETIHAELGSGEPSIYDILTQNLTEQELAKLEGDILDDHPGYDVDEDDHPDWNDLKLEDLMAYGEVRWGSFVKYFKMKDNEENPAVYLHMTFYFLPNCEIAVPTGSTGTDNFGVLAKYPVLVE
jgi:Flp pilus assembly protein TadG